MTKVHYDTVSSAIEKLRAQGFTIDFNLAENSISSPHNSYNPDDFEVVDAYRYEGITDPGDEAVVYAIQSKSGEKGILVTGYGPSAVSISAEMIKKFDTR